MDRVRGIHDASLRCRSKWRSREPSCPAVDQRRARGDRHPQLAGECSAALGARRRAGQARPARRARRAHGDAQQQATQWSIRPRRWQRQVRPEPGQGLRHHQPAANRGNRCAAGRVPGGGRAPVRGAEFAPYLYARRGGPIKTEADPVDETPPPNTGQTFAAIAHLEKATTGFGGVALRYGGFYGAANDALIEPLRKRQFPIVGDGGGIFSWLHLDDGATATVAALERSGPAIYNIVDDEPAPLRDWLPMLASALGAKPPRRCRPGSRACSPARQPSSWPPRSAAPPTPRPGANSARLPGTPVGASASRRPTRPSRSPTGPCPTGAPEQLERATGLRPRFAAARLRHGRSRTTTGANSFLIGFHPIQMNETATSRRDATAF